jgi:long-chain acyl-CoA synthetase
VNILVFPEGERSLTGEQLPFRRGLGIMANELRVPVVPVHIADIRQVLPRNGTWPRRHRVTVTFGRPVIIAGQDEALLVMQLEQAVRSLSI